MPTLVTSDAVAKDVGSVRAFLTKSDLPSCSTLAFSCLTRSCSASLAAVAALSFLLAVTSASAVVNSS